MNENQIPIYGIKPKTSVGVLSAATAGSLGTTTNAVIVVTADVKGCIIDSLVVNTNDTTAINLFVSIVGSDGTTVKPLGIVNVPFSSGNAANTLNVNLLNSLVLLGTATDQYGKNIIRLGPSETLRVSTLANMTAAKSCYVTAQYSDY